MPFVLLLCLLATTSTVFAQCGKVISVKDGDTFEILFPSNQKQRVRVAFVDAPEHQQDFGDKSKLFATSLLLNKNVCLDVKYKDLYKRAVAVVKLGNGKILNEELLKSGMVWHYFKFSDDKHLAALELQARKSKLGLWSTNAPEAPWIWRKQHHIGFKPRSKKF